MHLFRHYSTALSAVSSWCKSLRAFNESATFKSSVQRCREEAEIAQRCRYTSNRVAIRRTAIIEATVGAPGLSIPMGLADNSMPVGIQIQSRPGAQNFTTVQILSTNPTKFVTVMRVVRRERPVCQLSQCKEWNFLLIQWSQSCRFSAISQLDRMLPFLACKSVVVSLPCRSNVECYRQLFGRFFFEKVESAHSVLVERVSLWS